MQKNWILPVLDLLLSLYHLFSDHAQGLRFNSHINSTKSFLPFHLQLESWHQLTRYMIPKSRWMKSIMSSSPTTAVMISFKEEVPDDNVKTISSYKQWNNKFRQYGEKLNRLMTIIIYWNILWRDWTKRKKRIKMLNKCCNSICKNWRD